MIEIGKQSVKNRKQGVSDESIKIDEQDDHKKDTKSLFMNIWRKKTNKNKFANFFVILATIFYLVTLKGCSNSQAECLKNFDQTTIKYFVAILISSSFMYSLVFSLAIYKQIHYIIPIYTSVLICYLCFIYDTGTDLKSHGSYNRVFLFTFMFISFLVQQFSYLLFKIAKRISLIKFIIGVGILMGIAVVVIHFKLRSSCDLWTAGLGGKHIDNSKGCKIKKPYYCWMNLMDNVFDVSGFLGENCEQIRMDSRTQVIRWTKIPQATVVGYPRTENFKFFPDSTLDQFQFRVLNGMINMEDPRVDKKVKERTEIILNFKDDQPTMKMRTVRDPQIVKKRENIRKNFLNKKFISKNVVHLFIDSLSRDNFRRKLPKTRAWLDKYYNNKKSEARVYQFFKYHAIASWTFINMIPVNFGVEGSYQGTDAIHHNKYFKENGFILGQVHNYCGREFFDLEKGNVEKFHWEPFDHEANLFSCDPNYSVPGHPYALLNGPYGMKRRCLYGKDTSHYVFEYGKQFWKTYPNEPKYLRLQFLDAHEGTGEVVKYMDDKIIDWLEFMEKQGSLKDTVILLHADHGVNMPGFYTFVDAEDFWIEKSLPALFLIVPQEVANDYNDIIESKENMLLSPYDIHNTFLHLAGAPKIAYNDVGKSIFVRDDNGDERNCDQFRIVDPYCQCFE